MSTVIAPVPGDVLTIQNRACAVLPAAVAFSLCHRGYVRAPCQPRSTTPAPSRLPLAPDKPVLRAAAIRYHRPMASDNRDWYRDWWRKKTGYVERAGFRMSEGDRQRAKHAREWRAILVKLALFVLAVVVLIVLKRTML